MIDANTNIAVSKSLTFDLNGFKLEGSVSDASRGAKMGLFQLTANADLTIKSDKRDENGELIKGKLINKTEATNYACIIATNYNMDAVGNVTLENCEVTLSGKGNAYGVYNYTPINSCGNLTVNNCIMDISGAKATYAINHSARSGQTPAVTVENSKIEVTTNNNNSGYGVYTSTMGSANLIGNTINVTDVTSGTGIRIGATDNANLSGNTVNVQANQTADGIYAAGAIGGTAEISKNTITLTAGSGKNACPVNSASTPITLTDGTYTVTSGVPLFKKVTVEGGSFSFAVPVDQCKKGYYCAPVGDDRYALAEITSENASVVATKDGEETRYYMTLSSAASECGEGWTLTATKDFTDSSIIGSYSVHAAAEIIIKSGVTVTTSKAFYAANLTVEAGAAVIVKLTFTVSGVNNGTITLTDGAYSITLSNFTNNGSILLQKSDESSGFKLTAGENVVNNGTIRCEGEGSNSYFQLVVSADGITGENSYDYRDNAYAPDMKYYWDYTNNVWYEYYGAATIIKPDGTQSHYKDFRTAYDAAEDGDFIRLNETQRSVFFNNDTNNVEKNITVDLNGYELEANCSYANKAKWAIGVTGNHTLTIIDSSEAKSGRIAAVGSPTCVVKVNNGGTLTLDGVTLEKGTNIVYSEGGAETPDTIIVKNSTIIGTNYGINHNGSYYGVEVTVENSTVTAKGNSDYSGSGAAIYLSGQNGYKQNKLTVENSTIIGPTAIETKYSDAEVINSTISATAQTAAYLDGGNGICTMGFAVASTDNNAANSTGSIKISGDNTVVTGYVGLEASPIPEVQDVITDVRISGGSFDYEIPADHFAKGFTAVKNEDGKFDVVEASPAFSGFSENMLIIPMGEVEGQRQIALIMGIDTLRYSEVGFDVALNGESPRSYASTVVYRQVKDGAGNVWTPADLAGMEGGYLFTNTMGISTEYTAESFGEGAVVTVTPYAITLDGAKMTVNSYDIPIANFFN